MTKPDTISSLRSQTTGMTAEHIRDLAFEEARLRAAFNAARHEGAIHAGAILSPDGTLTVEVSFYDHDSDEAEEA